MSVEATSNPGTGVNAQGRRLESWKEIAAYLGRDITTVRRWEKREGLPVHRLLHSKLGSVYAYSTELDAWRRKRAAAATPVAAEVRPLSGGGTWGSCAHGGFSRRAGTHPRCWPDMA
jgi:hypothetical protein